MRIGFFWKSSTLWTWKKANFRPSVMKVLLSAKVGAPVGEKGDILPLYPFPDRFPLVRRIMKGNFLLDQLLASTRIGHVTATIV